MLCKFIDSVNIQKSLSVNPFLGHNSSKKMFPSNLHSYSINQNYSAYLTPPSNPLKTIANLGYVAIRSLDRTLITETNQLEKILQKDPSTFYPEEIASIIQFIQTHTLPSFFLKNLYCDLLSALIKRNRTHSLSDEILSIPVMKLYSKEKKESDIPLKNLIESEFLQRCLSCRVLSPQVPFFFEELKLYWDVHEAMKKYMDLLLKQDSIGFPLISDLMIQILNQFDSELLWKTCFSCISDYSFLSNFENWMCTLKQVKEHSSSIHAESILMQKLRTFIPDGGSEVGVILFLNILFERLGDCAETLRCLDLSNCILSSKVQEVIAKKFPNVTHINIEKTNKLFIFKEFNYLLEKDISTLSEKDIDLIEHFCYCIIIPRFTLLLEDEIGNGFDQLYKFMEKGKEHSKVIPQRLLSIKMLQAISNDGTIISCTLHQILHSSLLRTRLKCNESQKPCPLLRISNQGFQFYTSPKKEIKKLLKDPNGPLITSQMLHVIEYLQDDTLSEQWVNFFENHTFKVERWVSTLNVLKNSVITSPAIEKAIMEKINQTLLTLSNEKIVAFLKETPWEFDPQDMHILDLSGCKLDGDSLQQIHTHFPKIRHLKLHSIPKDFNIHLFDQLFELSITAGNLMDLDVSSFIGLNKLELGQDFRNVNANLLKKIPKNLQNLRIYRGNLTGVDFSSLKLKKIKLYDVQGVSADFINQLPKTLRSLEIHKGNLVNANFSHLEKLKKLTLYHRVQQIDNAVIKTLNHALQTLSVPKSTPIKEFSAQLLKKTQFV